MRLVWRVSVIKLGEAADTVLADVFEEALDKIFSPALEHISHHPEAYIYIWCQKYREGTSLMICKVTVYL